MACKKIPLYGFIFIIFLSISCDDSEPAGYQDPELKEYINRFVDEAKLRGKSISVGTLTATFEGIVNRCSSSTVNPKKITITRACWDNLPEEGKELLIFHELGHAVLGRGDLTDLLPNGDAKSIMTPDPTTLYNSVTLKKREYYLDELFDPLAAIPIWGGEKKNASVVLFDDIQSANEWQYRVINGAQHISSISNTVFSSSPSSLSIKSAASGNGFSYWAYAFKPSGFEEGNAVEVSVKIKGVGLTGGGAYMAIRGDVENKMVFFYTMQAKSPVLGTTDFTEYTLKVNYYPSTLDWFYIFLILDGTSGGDVFFDDVKLTKYN